MQTRWFRLARFFCCLFVAAVAYAQTPVAAQPVRPVAVVNGQPVYEDDLPSVQSQLLQLRTQEYEIKRKALDSMIDQKLLSDAAKKKGSTSEQLLTQEVNAKIPDPSDTEVEAYYFALKDRLSRPFDEMNSQLRQNLKQAKIDQARQEYLKKLRADANVVILLSAPRVNVDYDPARVRGNPKAPVMIVEFSDYQCPYCHQVEPTLKQVLAKYGDRVSLAYRDYPLRAMHSEAEIAAEASRCALEQGKYWEYHDQLFAVSNLAAAG
jgi:protein-disulfide isomerase